MRGTLGPNPGRGRAAVHASAVYLTASSGFFCLGVEDHDSVSLKLICMQG